jgi:hypothetical protein
MERNKDGSATFAREELYQKVWAKPIRHLAKELGLSDVGLAKICKKHKIPRPPVGYWAKRQHGKKVRRTPLPAVKDPAFEEVKIRPNVEDDVDNLRPKIQQGIRAESLPENVIVVRDELVDPLPIVEKTAKSLHSAKADEWGRVKPRAKTALNVSVTPGSIDRVTRVLDALLKALKKRSYPVSSNGESGIAVDVHGESLEFTLTEEVNRDERELTPREKRKIEEHPWLYRETQYRYVPSGRLSLEILTYGREKVRRRWTDGKRQRIENVLNSFVVSLLKISDAVYTRRLEEEERRRRREEWERQRGEKLRLIREEEERLKHLNAESDAWHYSQRLRAYVAAVRDAVIATHGRIEEGSPCASWLAWATQQADRADPLTESVASILDEKSKWECRY